MKRLSVFFSIIAVVALSGPVRSEIVEWTVATVDNESVTFGQWQTAWNEVQAGLAQMKQAGIAEPTPLFVLDRLISSEILSIEAKKRQIDVSEEDIDERVDRVKKMNNLTDEMFRKALRDQGMKLEDLREQFRTQVRNEKLQQMEIVPRVARPEDAELRAYYEKNKAKMLTPEKRRVSHILFLQDEAIPLADQVKFKKTIEKVYQEAMAGGDFAKLAAQYSQDEASRENGGDIGWVEPGSLSPEFEAVVFQLKKGRVSEVFPSRAGLHIVKVTDIRPAAPLSFEDAKNQIRDVILQEAFEKEFERWVEEKKTSYGIRIHLRNGDTFTFERGLWHGVDGKTVTSADLNGLLKRELDASENAGGAAVR